VEYKFNSEESLRKAFQFFIDMELTTDTIVGTNADETPTESCSISSRPAACCSNSIPVDSDVSRAVHTIITGPLKTVVWFLLEVVEEGVIRFAVD
jgi:hypothetical protein